MENAAILVTGGCGYIGSHAVHQLSQAGLNPVVVDNLSTGSRAALLNQEPFYLGDCGDKEILDFIFNSHKIDTIMHFAASVAVSDSVIHPLAYYENNVSATVRMLDVAVSHGIKNIIFSSSAAVYGTTSSLLVDENSPLNPESPYGRTKLMCEQIIADVAMAHGLNYVILRYFNVAGADPFGKMGQRWQKSTHLFKVLCEVLTSKKEQFNIYGDDYNTPDGTAIRDYIHVMDVASAHVLAVRRAREAPMRECFNCGYGRGYSVKEVLDATKHLVGLDFAVRVCPRRSGDVERVVADNRKIVAELGWLPQYDDLEKIIMNSYEWEKKLDAQSLNDFN